MTLKLKKKKNAKARPSALLSRSYGNWTAPGFKIGPSRLVTSMRGRMIGASPDSNLRNKIKDSLVKFRLKINICLLLDL